MLPNPQRPWAAPWRVVLLACVAALLCVAYYGLWTRAAWQLPTEYRGDAPEAFAGMRAAADGHMWPFQSKVIERLGAPFGASWNAYPTPDKPLLLLLGGLSHLIGLFAAANVGLVLAQVLAALSFYFVARWLRVRWEWAAAGALLFAYTYHTFHRGIGHLSVMFCWAVPLGLLAVWLVARSKRLAWGTPGAFVCAAAALALGFGNPYNLYFWAQLMGWALVAQWLGQRRRENLVVGVATLGLAAVAFVGAHLEVWVHVQEEGVPLVARNYQGTELYALKPMEMFIPPAFHKLPEMAFLAQRYQRWSEWRGELYLPYLGVVGGVAFLWLSALAVRALVTRRAVPGQALPIAWLIAFSTVGGVTNVFALIAGLHIFRATNRVAIFISAIALVFFVVRMSRLTIRWPRWAQLALPVAITAFGLWDQIPRRPSPQRKAEIAQAVESDRQLVRALEAELPAGAMIFQLPVMGFPEVVPPSRLADYEHFRPYVNSSQLRFSYGAAKYRSRSRWQRDLENAPTRRLVRELERYGFAALYLNRKGFEDRAEKLLAELQALGYDRRIEGRQGNQVVVMLKPAARPELPLARQFTYGRGWFLRPDDGVRWANEDAFLAYFNPYPHPLRARIALEFRGPDERELQRFWNDQPLARVAISPKGGALSETVVELAPGVNQLEVRSARPAVRLGTGRYQLRAFGLESGTIRVRKVEPES